MATHLNLGLSLAISLALTGCVGRGRYLETLLTQEAALSEAAAARSDLEDAARRNAALREELAALNTAYRSERDRAYETQSGNLTERQQLLRQRAVQALVADSLRREVARLDAQRSGALAVLARRDDQVRVVRERVLARAGNFRPGEFALGERDGALRLQIAGDALFSPRGKRETRISGVGEASLANIANALGGRPDLRIDVVCYVRGASARPGAIAEATRRAGLVVDDLVIGHGLLPGIVRAVGAVRGGGAESGPLGDAPVSPGGADGAEVEIVVRFRGSPLEAIGEALR